MVPSSSMSIRSAAGCFGSPGIVRIGCSTPDPAKLSPGTLPQ